MCVDISVIMIRVNTNTYKPFDRKFRKHCIYYIPFMLLLKPYKTKSYKLMLTLPPNVKQVYQIRLSLMKKNDMIVTSVHLSTKNNKSPHLPRTQRPVGPW